MNLQTRDMNKPKILVVDDEPSNVDLLKTFLSTDYDVVTAYDGAEALLKVETTNPDIILLDIVMPGLSGFEVCKRLKTNEKTLYIPIVMVTALNEWSDRVKGIDAGADDFLGKPIDFNELSLRIKSLLRIKQYHDKLELVKQELLVAAEEKYRNLIDNASDAIIIHDLEDKVLSWNHGAEKIFGWKTEEVIGKKISQLIIPPNKQDEADQMDQDALHDRVVAGIDTEYIRKDGSTIDVNVTISPLRDANNNIISLSSIIRNITELKQAEGLKLANIELIKVEKLKSQFLSVVSHELRTPLTPMKAQLQMVLAGYFGDVTEKQKNSLEMVLRNTTRQDRLIGNILDISKLEAGVMKYSMSKNSLNRIVENIVKMLKSQARDRNITLTLKEDTLPETIFDKDRISEVVENLIYNALKFTNFGGKVDVELSDNTDHANFKIKDNGIGIVKEDQERIFKPFEQVDSSASRQYEGSGIGLPICKGIITQHGGKLWVESELGKGTTFQFTMPYNNEMKEVQVKLDLLINDSLNNEYEVLKYV